MLCAGRKEFSYLTTHYKVSLAAYGVDCGEVHPNGSSACQAADDPVERTLTNSLQQLVGHGLVTVDEVGGHRWVRPQEGGDGVRRARQVLTQYFGSILTQGQSAACLASLTPRELVAPAADVPSPLQFLAHFTSHMPLPKDFIELKRKPIHDGFISYLPPVLRTNTYQSSTTDAGALCTPALALASLFKGIAPAYHAMYDVSSFSKTQLPPVVLVPPAHVGEDGRTKPSDGSLVSTGTQESSKSEVQLNALGSDILVDPARQLPTNPAISCEVVQPMFDISRHSSIGTLPLPLPAPVAAPSVASVTAMKLQLEGAMSVAQPGSDVPHTPAVVVATAPVPPVVVAKAPAAAHIHAGKKRSRAATVSFDLDASGTRRNSKLSGPPERIKRARVTYEGGTFGVPLASGMLVSQRSAVRAAQIPDASSLHILGITPSDDSVSSILDYPRMFDRFGLMPELQHRRRGGDNGPLEDGSLRLASTSQSLIGNGMSFAGAYMSREGLYVTPCAALDAPVTVQTAGLQWAGDVAPLFQQLSASDPQLVDSSGVLIHLPCADGITAESRCHASPCAPTSASTPPASNSADFFEASLSTKARGAVKLDDEFAVVESSVPVNLAVPIPVTVKTSGGSDATVTGLLKLQPYDPHTSQNPTLDHPRTIITKIRPVQDAQMQAEVNLADPPPSIQQAPPKLDVFVPFFREFTTDEVYGTARLSLFEPEEALRLGAVRPWGVRQLGDGTTWTRPVSVWDVFSKDTKSPRADDVAPFSDDVQVEQADAFSDEELLTNEGYAKLHEQADAAVRLMIAESMKRMQALRDKLAPPASPSQSPKENKSKSKQRKRSPVSGTISPGASTSPASGLAGLESFHVENPPVLGDALATSADRPVALAQGSLLASSDSPINQDSESDLGSGGATPHSESPSGSAFQRPSSPARERTPPRQMLHSLTTLKRDDSLITDALS
jgi:hypothetical protein